MSAWPRVKLGTLADFKNGLNFAGESWGRGLKIIGVSDFGDRMLPDYESLDEINPRGVARDQDMLEENDVLFVRSNGNRQLIGRCLFIKGLREPVSHSGFTIRLRFKLGAAVHPPFFVYLFRSSMVRQVLSDFGGGTNINNLNQRILEQLLVPVPGLAAQRKIAAILSAYDDLIASNQRRIALLETMAEEIYSEWFVRLRFPGRETARLIRGLPEGWSEQRVSDIAEVNARSVRRGHEPEVIGYIDISAVGTNEMGEPAEMKYTEAPGRARRLVRHGDILWSSVRPGNKAYCLVVEPPDNLVASTGFAVISPKPGTPYTYLYKAVTTQNFTDQMVAVAKGSAYPATSFDDFGKARIVWPNAELLVKFHERCQPMIECCAGLRKSIASLRKQRDALLPRLISGKLKIDHLDIRLPPSMQDKVTA